MSSLDKKKTAKWYDSSNGWTCSNCWRDSISAFRVCPNCNRMMRNGYVKGKEQKNETGTSENGY